MAILTDHNQSINHCKMSNIVFFSVAVLWCKKCKKIIVTIVVFENTIKIFIDVPTSDTASTSHSK